MAVRVLIVFYLLQVTFTPLNGSSINATLCQFLKNDTNTRYIDNGHNSKEGVILSPAYFADLSTVNISRGCYFTINKISEKVFVMVDVILESDNSTRCHEEAYLNTASSTSLTVSIDKTSCSRHFKTTQRQSSDVSFFITANNAREAEKYFIQYSVLPLFAFPIDNGSTIDTAYHPSGYFSTNTSMNSTALSPGVYELTLHHPQYKHLTVSWTHVELDPGSFLQVIIENSTDQSQKCNSTANCPAHICSSTCTVTIQLIVEATDNHVKNVFLRYTADEAMATDNNVTRPFTASSTLAMNTTTSTPHLNQTTAGGGRGFTSTTGMTSNNNSTASSRGSLSTDGTTSSNSSTTSTNIGGFDLSSNVPAIVGVAVGSSVLLVVAVIAIICVVVRRTSITRKARQASQQNPAITHSIFYDDENNYDTIDLIVTPPPCQGEDNFYHVLDDSPATPQRGSAVEERNIRLTLQTTDSLHYYEAASLRGSHLTLENQEEDNSRNNNTLKSTEELYELIDDTRCEPSTSCSKKRDSELEEGDYEEHEIQQTGEIEMFDNELYEPSGNFKK